jgi:hypothetical protein
LCRLHPSVVGDTGFEPVTSSVSTRSTWLIYLRTIAFSLLRALVPIGLRRSQTGQEARSSPRFLPATRVAADLACGTRPIGMWRRLGRCGSLRKQVPGCSKRPFATLAATLRVRIGPVQSYAGSLLQARYWSPFVTFSVFKSNSTSVCHPFLCASLASTATRTALLVGGRNSGLPRLNSRYICVAVRPATAKPLARDFSLTSGGSLSRVFCQGSALVPGGASGNRTRIKRTTIGTAPLLNSTSGRHRINILCVIDAAYVAGAYERSFPLRAFSHQKVATVNRSAHAATITVGHGTVDPEAPEAAITGARYCCLVLVATASTGPRMTQHWRHLRHI